MDPQNRSPSGWQRHLKDMQTMSKQLGVHKCLVDCQSNNSMYLEILLHEEMEEEVIEVIDMEVDNLDMVFMIENYLTYNHIAGLHKRNV